MKLFFRKYGSGKPLIILHGLFGQSDNWNTLGKRFAEQFAVYLVDLRNHGLSPHSEEWNYKVMSDDLLELIEENRLQNPVLLGHSMGGKVAMQFALDHPGRVAKMVVVDIAPRCYDPHHDKIIKGLQAIDFDVIKSRKEAEDVLSNYIPDAGTRQFLLKNLYWKEEGRLAWRFNLEVIAKNIQEVNVRIGEVQAPNPVPVLFISGEKSDYITEKDRHHIPVLFPNAGFVVVKNAGHWVHAEQPEIFFSEAFRFLTAGE